MKVKAQEIKKLNTLTVYVQIVSKSKKTDNSTRR